MKIDFTTTAMPRPDILERCLASFQKNMFGIDIKKQDMYINIDPFPYISHREYEEIHRLRRGVIAVAEKYFKKVIYNTPLQPNYAAAYKWVWSAAKTEYIFNLEDDWELIKPIYIPHLIKRFQNNSTLREIVLRAYTYKYPTFCTSPAFLNRKFYRNIAIGMNVRQNPECQIHKDNNGRYKIFIPNKKNGSLKPYGQFKNMIDKFLYVYPKHRSVTGNIIVKDIGREWFKTAPYITPLGYYDRKMRIYKIKKRKKEIMGIIYKATPPKKVKKVNFLHWVRDDENNPLNWLMEYKI